MVLAFHDPLSGYGFTIHSYQWGFTTAMEYVTRDFGVTQYGAWYRQPTAYRQPRLKVRFTGQDVAIDQLQQMTMIAQRHGNPVQFYPDFSVPNFTWVLWPGTVDLGRVVENREEIELELTYVDMSVQPPPLQQGDDLERRSMVSVTLLPLRGGVIPTGADLEGRRERRFVTGLRIRYQEDDWLGNWPSPMGVKPIPNPPSMLPQVP